MKPFQPSCMLHCGNMGRTTGLVFLGPTQATAETTLPKAIHPSHSLRPPYSMKCCSNMLISLRQEKAEIYKGLFKKGKDWDCMETGDSCFLFNFSNWKTPPPCVSSPKPQQTSATPKLLPLVTYLHSFTAISNHNSALWTPRCSNSIGQQHLYISMLLFILCIALSPSLPLG